MNPVDNKILQLLDILKDNGTIRFDIEFCRAIDLRKQNLYNIKQGKNHFTTIHISKIIDVFNINGNWIFGKSSALYRR